MKTLLVAIIPLCFAAVSLAADTPTLDGNWNLHNSIAGNESDMACALVQQETVLTGKCASDNGSVDLTGKVDGAKVSFTFKVEHQGTTYTLEYAGTVEAGKSIKGTVNVAEAGATGDFAATRSK